MRRGVFQSKGSQPSGKPTCIMTVDVEDWFHILDVPLVSSPSQWEILPSRVERNFLHLLDLFADSETHVTCFFLGWIARRFPNLVRRAAHDGHEIASHGYAHCLVYRMTQDQFREDAGVARRILEDISGRPVLGYRAAGFSAGRGSPWFFEELVRAGYRYDASIFPARRNHGGFPAGKLRPYWVSTGAGRILEFPQTVKSIFGIRLCFFGGGYLRISPLRLIQLMSWWVRREQRPVIFYIHPREIDPHQPRLEMNLRRRFETYVNLGSTQRKIRALLANVEGTCFSEFIQRNDVWSAAVAEGNRPAAASATPEGAGLAGQ